MVDCVSCKVLLDLVSVFQEQFEELLRLLLLFSIVLVYEDGLHNQLVKPVEVFVATVMDTFSLVSFFIWVQMLLVTTVSIAIQASI